MAVGKAVYETEVDQTGIKRGAAEAERTLKGAVAGVDGKVGGLQGRLAQMSKSGGLTGAILGGAGVGVGLGVFQMVTDAIGKTVEGLTNMAKAAREDEANQQRLLQALNNNAKGWDGSTTAINERIKAAQRLGFADTEVRDSLGGLVTKTKDLNQALDLQTLAMDLSRAKNISLEAAADLVGKAYTGQIGALRRAGLAIDANATSTEALAALQKAVGGQAETFARTEEGAAKAAGIAWSELGESIGRLVLPAFTLIATVGRDILMPALQAIVDLVSGPLGPGIAAVAVAVGVALVPALVAAAAAAWAFIAPMLLAAAPFVALGLAVAIVVDALGGMGAVMKGVGDAFRVLQDIVGRILAGILEPFRALFDVLSHLPGEVGKTFAAMRDRIDKLQADLEAAGEAAGESFIRGINTSLATGDADRGFAGVVGRGVGAAEKAASAGGRSVGGSFAHQMEQVSDAVMVPIRKTIKEAAAAAARIPQLIGSEIRKHTNDLFDDMANLRRVLKNGMTPKEIEIRLTGKEWIKDLRAGLRSEIPGAKADAMRVATETVESLSGGAPSAAKTRRLGEVKIELMKAGMTAKEWLAVRGAAIIRDATVDELGKKGSEGTYGGHLADRYIGGVRSRYNAAWSAGSYIANAITSRFALSEPGPETAQGIRDSDTYGAHLVDRYIGGMRRQFGSLASAGRDAAAVVAGGLSGMAPAFAGGSLSASVAYGSQVIEHHHRLSIDGATIDRLQAAGYDSSAVGAAAGAVVNGDRVISNLQRSFSRPRGSLGVGVGG